MTDDRLSRAFWRGFAEGIAYAYAVWGIAAVLWLVIHG